MTNKEKFYERIDSEYETFIEEIEEYDSQEFIEKAEYIADMKSIYEYLMRDKPIDDEYLEHYMKLISPLHTICDEYQEEKAPIYDSLNHVLWTIRDKEILDFESNEYSDKLIKKMQDECKRFRENLHLHKNIQKMEFAAQSIFKPGFSFSWYDAQTLLQLKEPLKVIAENMGDNDYEFDKILEKTLQHINGTDLLTQPYALENDNILPETKYRHKAINTILEIVPHPDYETTASWMNFFYYLNVDCSEQETIENDPYISFTESLEAVYDKYGGGVLQKLYEIGKENPILENEIMYAANYLSKGGDISKIPEMAKNDLWDDSDIEEAPGGMDLC